MEEGERDPSCGRSEVPEGNYQCNTLIFKVISPLNILKILLGDKDLILRLLMEAKTINNWYGTDVWDLRDLRE